MVEAHWADVQNGMYKFDGHYTTGISSFDPGNGVWQVDNTGHLVFIKYQNVQNPDGMVEIHFDELKGNSYERLGHDYVSDLSTIDAANGVWLATEQRPL